MIRSCWGSIHFWASGMSNNIVLLRMNHWFRFHDTSQVTIIENPCAWNQHGNWVPTNFLQGFQSIGENEQ
jgi:hypothetical protein